MLHASAVRLEQGLILFIGESGAGKSTLAGNFHQVGIPAVSDDCVWIKEGEECLEAVPSYGGLRLWEDSVEVLFGAEQEAHSMAHYSAKKRVPLQENDQPQIGKGVPVLAVIVLSPADQISSPEIILEPLARREAFIAMLKQTFQLDLSDLERMSRHASALGRIVPRLPAYRLSMPRDYSLLPLARKKILEAVL
jgi:energy-coupling factor transporter ATP-binding protein EcfA2